MADRDYDARGSQLFDVLGSAIPLRRNSHQLYTSTSGILPAIVLFYVRRAYPSRRMRAARAVVWRNMWPLDVKGLHGVPVWKSFSRVRQIGESRSHRLRRRGDHGWKEACDSGRENCV